MTPPGMESRWRLDRPGVACLQPARGQVPEGIAGGQSPQRSRHYPQFLPHQSLAVLAQARVPAHVSVRCC
eukprot:2903994-Amphidinium_carterae.2